MFAELPRPPVLFGLAGIAPQLGCLALGMVDGDARWFVLAAGCCYAAVILSFLGGLWWMAALLTGQGGVGTYALAVVPSLLGWCALLPWCVGWPWPAPELVALGLALLASPLVDRHLARTIALPAGWLPLRRAMATGLGLATIALALM